MGEPTRVNNEAPSAEYLFSGSLKSSRVGDGEGAGIIQIVRHTGYPPEKGTFFMKDILKGFETRNSQKKRCFRPRGALVSA